MKMLTVVLGILAVVFAGCGYGNGDGNPNCPDMSGNWQFGYDCPMSSSGRSAEVTQDGCDITSLWKDDNTPAVDTLTGTVDDDGNTTVTIDFGDSMVTCTGLLSGSDWTSDCTPGDCQLIAEKLQRAVPPSPLSSLSERKRPFTFTFTFTSTTRLRPRPR